MTTAVSSELQFEESTHTYTRNGVVIPGVTDVLKSVGVIDDRWFTEESAWRGSVVHKCCALDDLGVLEESSVAEGAKGYLEAWRRFKDEVPIKDGAVIDLKTGVIQRSTEIQTAAYSMFRSAPHSEYAEHIERPMFYEEGWVCFAGTPDRFVYPAYRRIAVRLKPDGKYNIKEFPIHERHRDVQIFMAALAIRNWKESNR